MRNLPPEAFYAEWRVGSPLHALARPLELDEASPLRRWFYRVRLWRYESFGPSTSWSLFSDERPVSGKRAAVRKVVWESRETDHLDRTEDKITWSDYDCDPARAVALLSRLVGVGVVPVVPRKTISLDGVSYGIEHHEGFYFRWHEDGPTEWREFIARAGELRDYLDECCIEAKKRA